MRVTTDTLPGFPAIWGGMKKTFDVIFTSKLGVPSLTWNPDFDIINEKYNLFNLAQSKMTKSLYFMFLRKSGERFSSFIITGHWLPRQGLSPIDGGGVDF